MTAARNLGTFWIGWRRKRPLLAQRRVKLASKRSTANPQKIMLFPKMHKVSPLTNMLNPKTSSVNLRTRTSYPPTLVAWRPAEQKILLGS